MGWRNRLSDNFPATFGWLDSRNGDSALAVKDSEGPEVKSVAPALADFYPFDGQGGTIDRDVLDILGGTGTAYTASVLIHAAMRYRATKLSEPPLIVVDQEDEGEDEVDPHELGELLKFPNEDEEMADVLESLSLSLDDTGKALIVADPDRTGRPGRLVLFRGDEFSVHPTRDRIYGRFIVSARNSLGQAFGSSNEYLPEEVVFFRLPHPTDRWDGLGPVEVVAQQLRIEKHLLSALVHAIPNAITPGFTIAYPPEFSLTGTKLEEWRQKVRASYAGARNHGGPFVTGDGASVSKHSLGFEGLSGGNLYREIEAAVAMAFQVRPEILGMMIGLENAPWSHMQTAQRLAYDEGIIPLWRRIERTLTRQLLRRVDDDPNHIVRFETSMIRALQEDDLERAEVQEKLKGVTTRNQRRQIAGLDMMDDDPDDEPFWDEVEAAQSPIAVNMNGGLPGEDPPEEDDEEEEETAEERSARLRIERKRMEFPGALALAEFDLNTKAAEGTWRAKVEALLATLSRRVQALYRKHVRIRGTAPGEDPGQLDPESVATFLGAVSAFMNEEGKAQLRRTLEPLVSDTVTKSARRLTARLGFGFNIVQEGVRNYAQNETTFLVEKMGEHTGRKVAQTVQKALDERVPFTELRTRLGTLDAFSPKRAELVARTETTRATNGAQRRAAVEYESETGQRVEKTWISSRDDRVREAHDFFDDGDFYPIDHEWDGLTEPSEPNCRCTLGYRIVRPGD